MEEILKAAKIGTITGVATGLIIAGFIFHGHDFENSVNSQIDLMQHQDYYPIESLYQQQP